MKSIICLYLTIGCINGLTEERNIPKEIESLKQSLASWRQLADDPGARSTEEYIIALGSGLRKTSADNIFWHDPAARNGVREALQRTMLSIPGHAEYYRDRINEEREKYERLVGEGIEPPTSDLNNAQMYGLRTLSYLPSVETVRVLGEFLWDERIPGGEYNRSGFRRSLSSIHRKALMTLSKLPIANSPTEEIRHSGQIDDGLKAWRQWYAEVKDGRRTFRFIGDPVDYDLRGPSKRGALGPQPDRMGKRPEPEANGASPAVSQNVKEPGYLPYLVASGMLLAGLGYFLLRQRKCCGT